MIKIIPAIDIIDGKCVRLSKGDFNSKKIYNSNPLEVAKQFESAGIKNLHLVDLDGAKTGKIKNIEVLKTISQATKLLIDFGGGVKTTEDVISLLENGASKINLGSISVKNPNLTKSWIQEYGSSIILSSDVRAENVSINGWQSDTDLNIIDHINQFIKFGLTSIVCTDIDTDGMLKGPNFNLYKKLKTIFPNLEIIASGGVSNLQDIIKLNQLGIDGVIVGKAIYEGKITLKELSQFN